MFDVRGYNEKTRPKIKLDLRSKESSEKSRKELLSKVTTKDLLAFTPKVDEIFGSCRLRQTKNDHDGIRDLMGKECNEWFKVMKYLSNSKCCLKMTLPRWKGSLRYTDVTFDPFAEGIIRSFTLNNTLFDKVTSFKAFFTFGKSLGYKELQTAPTIDRGYDYSNRSNILQYLWDPVSRGKLYSVENRSYSQLKLQVTEKNVKAWPHRKCSEELSKENELAACLSRETNKNFQKHSPMSFIIDGDDHKILSVSDFHDDWEMKAWKNILNKCHEATDHIKECDDVRVVTTVDERLAGQGNNITLVELVPANLSFEYIHDPKMDIETFLLLIGAILSTGFGFSLYTWRGCRWNRFKKDGKCCYFGFKSQIEDPEAERVTRVVDDQKTDRELIVQMWDDISKQNTELRKINQTLLQVIGAVDPIRTGMKKLETDVDKLKKKTKKTVNRHDFDEIIKQLSQRRH